MEKKVSKYMGASDGSLVFKRLIPTAGISEDPAEAREQLAFLKEGLEDNLRAILSQTYQPLRLIFIVESETDRALPIIRNVSAGKIPSGIRNCCQDDLF